MAGPSLTGQPRTVLTFRTSANATAVTAAGTYIFATGASAALPTVGSTVHPFRVFEVTPSEWEVYNKELLWQLSSRFATGDVSPAQSAFLSVFAVAQLGGLTANPTITLGAEVTGSRTPTRTFLTPNALLGPDYSGAFELPGPGWYCFGLTAAGGLVATSYIALNGRLSALAR